jgi:hypothetical protein
MLQALTSAAALIALLVGPLQTAPKQATPKPTTPKATTPKATTPRQTNTNAAVLKDFVARVEKYVELHKKAEATLPALPKQTDPKQIDAHERALGKLIQAARADAKQGDLFTPAMQRLVRNLLVPIFRGKDGAQIKAEITDNEYKGAVKLVVNGRYPDEVPISTVPTQVLEQLPKLPEEIEYRFVRTNLILFDPHAHLIPDFVERAIQ